MAVDWTDGEVEDVETAGEVGGTRAAMTRVVELVAARGGTMTAEGIEHVLEGLGPHTVAGPVGVRSLRGHMRALGATVATLQAKVEELTEKVRVLAVDLDLERTVSRNLKHEDRARRAEVERLEARTWIQCTMTSNDCLGGCRSLEEHDRYRHQALLSEVERLKAEAVGSQERSRTLLEAKNHWADHARAAVSRLAAIRERANSPAGLRRALEQARADGPANGATPMGYAVAVAPQEAKANGSLVIGDDGAPVLLTRDGTRYPCSPTCTHDDSATPGHPERVKERSEAMWKIVAPDAPPDSSAAACEGDASWTAGFEFGKEQGAEAMRAALLIEAKAACDQHGVGWLYQHLKHRIESATP